MLKMRTRKAFTLLELTVAIVVLGILAALAIPTFLGVINGSRQAAAQTSALAVSRDAIALAALSGNAVSGANLVTAAAETSGVTVTSNSAATAGTAFTAKFAVVNGSNTTYNCVNEPATINGAPAYAGLSGTGGC